MPDVIMTSAFYISVCDPSRAMDSGSWARFVSGLGGLAGSMWNLSYVESCNLMYVVKSGASRHVVCCLRIACFNNGIDPWDDFMALMSRYAFEFKPGLVEVSRASVPIIVRPKWGH